jgi:hypothetical protein
MSSEQSYQPRHNGLWSFGVDWFLTNEVRELATTADSILQFRDWATTFHWHDRHDFIAQIDRAFAALTIFRDRFIRLRWSGVLV